jgi:hypothetical protein
MRDPDACVAIFLSHRSRGGVLELHDTASPADRLKGNDVTTFTSGAALTGQSESEGRS